MRASCYPQVLSDAQIIIENPASKEALILKIRRQCEKTRSLSVASLFLLWLLMRFISGTAIVFSKVLVFKSFWHFTKCCC